MISRTARQRVELAPLHLVEQPPQLGIVRDRVLADARFARDDATREHLAGEVPPPPLLEPAVAPRGGAMRRELLPEHVDVLCRASPR